MKDRVKTTDLKLAGLSIFGCCLVVGCLQARLQGSFVSCLLLLLLPGICHLSLQPSQLQPLVKSFVGCRQLEQTRCKLAVMPQLLSTQLYAEVR